MLKASPDQAETPRPSHRWPVVANRHRKAAMTEAQEILNLINEDFIELLQDEIGDELQEALMSIRRNPAKAIKHVQLALRSLTTIGRSAELVHKRAEAILTVLETAPADAVEKEEAA